MSKPNTRQYVRTFVNPLLAIAFRDGVNFVGDPDYKALDPTQEGKEWEVIIEHDYDDEDDEDDVEVIHPTPMGPLPAKRYAAMADSITPEKPGKKQTTFKDYEDRFNKMKPRSAPGSEEVIHFPVKPQLKISSEGQVVISADLVPIPEIEPEPLPPPPTEFKTTKTRTPIIFDPALLEDVAPCGKCIPCAAGGDCLEVIAAACRAMPGYRSER